MHLTRDERLDSAIISNITAALGCTKSEIHDIYPLKQGLTNLSYHFATDEGEWVYRHPGVGTESLVNRDAEFEALQAAHSLGLDRTFVTGSAEHGWKISRFVPDSTNLDMHDEAQLKVAMRMARTLHESGASVAQRFSFYRTGKGYEESLLEHGSVKVADYEDMERCAAELDLLLTAERSEDVLCHNDFFSLNFIVAPDGRIDLIDWEYAGMGDYANDFGTLSVCDQLTEEEMYRALSFYFGRTPTDDEWRHNLAHVGLAGWCWYVWALLKEAEGGNVGEWKGIYRRFAKTYLTRALDLYQRAAA